MLGLKLEALPGDTIQQVAAEMCGLANRLGAYVEVEFNTVRLVAFPGGSPDALVENFDAAWGQPEPRAAYNKWKRK